MRSFIELDPITREQCDAAALLMYHITVQYGGCPDTPEYRAIVARQQAIEYAKISGTLTYELVYMWMNAVRDYSGITLALEYE